MDSKTKQASEEIIAEAGVEDVTGSEDIVTDDTVAAQMEIDPETDASAKIDDLTSRLQLAMADFDNFRKRTRREHEYMRDKGLCETIEKLLPVFDNFERAMQSPPDKDDAFFAGMQMILKQLAGTLTDMGVCEIPALNEQFNPEIHFAVSHIDDANYGDNEVIEVLQKGYRYKEKVVRPSMVRVAN